VRAIAVAVLFMAALWVLAARGTLPLAVPAVYVAVSLATVIAYAIDKSAAESGRWRTRERTLHVLSVTGGWPGALVAQAVFHHKSQKPSFRIAFWTTVVVNCAALAWFLLYS
jgi:uncharacterized membrane protein YsdA (DUF1294 family)